MGEISETLKKSSHPQAVPGLDGRVITHLSAGANHTALVVSDSGISPDGLLHGTLGI